MLHESLLGTNPDRHPRPPIRNSLIAPARRLTAAVSNDAAFGRKLGAAGELSLPIASSIKRRRNTLVATLL
jgi:hypothetical protein